ncbi:MAG: ATP-binding protein [Acidimicrobiales bacterium]
MADARRSIVWWRAAIVGLGAVTVLLAVWAARADSRAVDASAWTIALDVAVGVAFVGAALWVPAPLWERVLIAAVGETWLAGSYFAGTQLVHQSVLIVALLAFPSGRPRGAASWMLVAVAFAVALKLFSQIGVGAVFAIVAVSALLAPRLAKVVVSYRALAASGVAIALSLSWIAEQTSRGPYGPKVALVVYEIVLLVVALTYCVAVRLVLSGGARLVDQFLGDARLVGLDGLSVVLRDVLGDPDLHIYRWLGDSVGYVDGHGHPAPLAGGERGLTYVEDSSGPLAVLQHRRAVLDDPPTAEAVSSALRLAVQNLRLREELDAQLADLEAARARLVAAADRQRSITASRLRDDVVAPLQRATSALSQWHSAARQQSGAVEAMDIAVQELATANDEVMALVEGVPPAELGAGRLCEAVEALARRSPLPVTVTATPAANGDAEMETALFYVCSEAMTNAAKHSGAGRIVVAIDGTGAGIIVSISDDGCGGADVSGSGLQGLADRLASRGGRLRVESPPGAGTTVTAIVPY